MTMATPTSTLKTVPLRHPHLKDVQEALILTATDEVHVVF